MKHQKRNSVFSVFFFFATALLLGFFIIPAQPVFASKTAETKANTHCSTISSGGTSLATRTRAACNKGFVAGYDGGDKAKTCIGSTKSACEKGFSAGTSAKDKAPETDGKAGAAAGEDKGQACSKYQNATNKAACQKAYDNQIIAMAQQAGQKAGEGGSPSPCNSLPFGGVKATAACKEAYTKGKNTAQKNARGHCGNVETYFDYSSACGAADKGKGGTESPIFRLLLIVLGWVTALVVLAVVGGIVYGGFLYLSARDSTSQTQKGVVVITNSVVALIAWVFAYALINFVVPGGLFNG